MIHPKTVRYGRTGTPSPPLRHILSLWNETAGLTVLGTPPHTALSEWVKDCTSSQSLYHVEVDIFCTPVGEVQQLIWSKNKYCPSGMVSMDGVKRWRVLTEVIFRSPWLVCPHRVIVALYWVSAHLCSCQHEREQVLYRPGICLC